MKKLFILLLFSTNIFAQLPKDFVYLELIDPSIKKDLRYHSSNNFIGKPINGYYENKVIITQSAAIALKKVQSQLKPFGLSLKIYDAYRPQQAVNHFVKWARQLSDTINKQTFYPNINKRNLFRLGYISSKSGHTRGSTVDLTLVDLKTGEELDMGSPFDFFGKISHIYHKNLTHQQRANRMLLKKMMNINGFRSYKNEWWHFTLRNEPFPNTFFDFPVK